MPPTKNALSLGGIWATPNTWFLGTTRVHIPHSISISSVMLAQLMVVTNRHTSPPAQLRPGPSAVRHQRCCMPDSWRAAPRPHHSTPCQPPLAVHTSAHPVQDVHTGLPVVKAVRGILMRECANLYKSMKIGTLVIFDMLCPNLPGAKANSQWCRHIRQFKMAAAWNMFFHYYLMKSHTDTNKTTFLGFLTSGIPN